MSQEDTTLGGYFSVHDRPPAWEGSDGHPYTVSLETEKTGDLTSPWEGYLVFPRWAQNGVGVVGHVETATIVRDRTEDEVLNALRGLDLHAVKQLLEGAIRASEEARSG